MAHKVSICIYCLYISYNIGIEATNVYFEVLNELHIIIFNITLLYRLISLIISNKRLNIKICMAQ